MFGRLRRTLHRQSKRVVVPGTDLETTIGSDPTVNSRPDDGVGNFNLKNRVGDGVVRPRRFWRNRRVAPLDAKVVAPASAPSDEIPDDVKPNEVSEEKNEPIPYRLPQGETRLTSILRYSLRVSMACTDLLHMYPDDTPDPVARVEEEEEREETREEKRARFKASAARKEKDRQRLPKINADLKRPENDPPQQLTPIVDDTSTDDPVPKTGPRLAWAAKNSVRTISASALSKLRQRVADRLRKRSPQN